MAVKYVDSQTLYSDSTVSYEGKKKNYLTLSVTFNLATDSIKKSLSLNEGALALMSYFPTREIKAVASVSINLAPSYNKIGVFLRTFNASVSVLSGAFKRLFLEFSSSLSLASSYLKTTYIIAAAILNLAADKTKTIIKSSLSTLYISSTNLKLYELIVNLSIALSNSAAARVIKNFSTQIGISAIKSRLTGKIGNITFLISSDNKKYYELTGNLDVSMTASALKDAYKGFSYGVEASASMSEITGKNVHISTTLSVAKSVFVGKIHDAMLALSSSEYEDNIMNIAASASLGATHILRIIKNRTTVMNLASSLSRVVGKLLSAAIILLSSVEKIRGRILQADTTLFVTRTVLSKNILETTILLSSSPNRFIQLTGNLLFSLNNAIYFFKAYDGILNGILSIVSQVNKIGNKVLMSSISLFSNKTKNVGINNVVSAQITAESDEISSKKVTFSGIFGVDSSISKHAALNKGTFFLVDGAENISVIGETSVIIFLDDEIVKKIEKEKTATTAAISSTEKRTMKEFGAELSLGAQMFFGRYDDFGIIILMDDQKAVKRVGKTFTIREHTPSVWHNC